MTWNSRPAIDGKQLAAFGPVTSGAWYEVDLPVSAAHGDGPMSLAMDSLSADGADWSSRESGLTPTLLLDVESGVQPAPPLLSTVADRNTGSSDPTYYGNNHRVVATAAGRLLTVHGRHASGVQLAWKDPQGLEWMRTTSGTISDGQLLSGTGTGDWPASIALAREPSGEEIAFVVWAGQDFGVNRPLQVRVLKQLDSPGRPSIGPVVTFTAPSLAAVRPDVGVEQSVDGTPRVAVTWAERNSTSTFALMVGWLDDYLSDSPALVSSVALLRDGSSGRTATIASTTSGVRVAARADGGRMRVYGHEHDRPLSEWWSSGPGPVIPATSYPSAVGLETGEVLVAAVRDPTQGTINVQRYTGPGKAPSTEFEDGHRDPAVAASGGETFLVAVRLADGSVVSRSAERGGGWASQERVEIGLEGGGNHSWPSPLPHAAQGVRFVVRGPGATANRSSVLAYERTQ